jgi:hypothetical protein
MDSGGDTGVKRRRFHITEDDDEEEEVRVPRGRNDDDDSDLGSNPDAYLGEDEQQEEDEVEGEDLADTWLQYEHNMLNIFWLILL